jgi:Cellulase (glycosyl hydrolase family 5)
MRLKRLNKTLIPTVLAAGMLAGGATDAQAARGMEIAVQDDSVFLNQAYYDRGRALQQARDMKVTTIRANLIWSRALATDPNSRSRPGTPRYNWIPWDSLIDHAAAYGIRVQLTLTGSAPAWAAGNGRVGNYKPNPRLFGQFARDAARHFRGRVVRYGIWNEPNYIGWLSPLRTAPQRYRSLYLSAYRGIKGVSRGNKVLIGETAPFSRNRRNAMSPLTFIRGMTRRGRLRADGYAHHPYAYSTHPSRGFGGRNDVVMGTLGRLSSTLSRLRSNRRLRTPRGGKLPIYLTEFGYHARGRFRVPDRRRASWLRAAFSRAARFPGVRQMTQYIFIEPNAGEFWDTRLIKRSGQPERPYRALASWARSAASKRLVKSPPRRVGLPRPGP